MHNYYFPLLDTQRLRLPFFRLKFSKCFPTNQKPLEGEGGGAITQGDAATFTSELTLPPPHQSIQPPIGCLELLPTAQLQVWPITFSETLSNILTVGAKMGLEVGRSVLVTHQQEKHEYILMCIKHLPWMSIGKWTKSKSSGIERFTKLIPKTMK